MFREGKRLLIVKAVELACLLEASSRKPGNVCPFRNFSEMGYTDFLFAAVNLGNTIYNVDRLTVGELIYNALERTFREVKVNVSLGIVLLLVPLAKAYWISKKDTLLRDNLKYILNSLTINDADLVYKAIKIVKPGGMGTVEKGDIEDKPDITLKEAMDMAKYRDSIAYEYTSNYKITFEFLYPRFCSYKTELNWEETIVQVFLELLAEIPDTLVARKYGMLVAKDVSSKARDIVDIGGIRTKEGREAISLFDDYLRDSNRKLNPGASADLIASGIMVYLLKNMKGRYVF